MKQRGFSIVEIMVGLVIGLLGTIVIFQVFAASEGYKRTTTAGGDSQQNGALALYTIERDAREAGSGLNAETLLNCVRFHSYLDIDAGGPALGGPLPSFSTAGVSIVDADGTAGSDTIVLRLGTSPRNGIRSQLKTNMAQPTSDLTLSSTYGFALDDLVVVSDGADCTLMQVTALTPLELQHAVTTIPPVYNPDTAYQSNPEAPDTPWPAYLAGSEVFSLGQTIVVRSYRVNGSNLEAQDFGAMTPAVADIVNVQAQYGIAPALGNDVNCWVDATNGGNACDAGNWDEPSPVDRKRIKAVRIAVVSRSALPERPSVAGGACDATALPLTTWTGGPVVDLSADATWQCYRYKVFQTIVPLRNVLWADL